MKIESGTRKAPRRAFLYGVHGIGKSTWARSSPRPIYLQTEDGLGDLGVDRSPLLKSWHEFYAAMSWVLTEEHQYQTLVIDTIDWLERLIHRQVAKDEGVEHVSEIPYGKGYGKASNRWDQVLDTLEQIRQHRNMAILVLGHAKIVKFEDPATEPYDRYEPDLHKSISNQIQEWADDVLFASRKVSTKATEKGFNQKRVRAIGEGQRLIYTRETPQHLAKSRLPSMPEELPLDFGVYAEALKQGVSGVVVNGSSKASKRKAKTDGKNAVQS